MLYREIGKARFLFSQGNQRREGEQKGQWSQEDREQRGRDTGLTELVRVDLKSWHRHGEAKCRGGGVCVCCSVVHDCNADSCRFNPHHVQLANLRWEVIGKAFQGVRECYKP